MKILTCCIIAAMFFFGNDFSAEAKQKKHRKKSNKAIAVQPAIDIKNPAPIEVPFFHQEGRIYHSRKEWIEMKHRTAPGVDWREIEADNRKALRESKMFDKVRKKESALAEPTLHDIAGGLLKGFWHERGSNNQSGSAANSEMDTRSGTIISKSASGNTWKATIQGNDWTLIDDAARLNYRLRFPNGVNGDRIIRWQGIVPQYSDDWGQTWQDASELAGLKKSRVDYSWGSIENMFRAKDNIVLVAKEWNGTPWGAKSVVYISQDKGKTYTQAYSTMDDFRLETNGEFSSIILFSSAGKLHRMTPSGIVQTLSNLPAENAEINGIFDNGKELYVYVRAGTMLYKSNNGATLWNQMGATADGKLTFVSREDHNLVACGFVDCYRSFDGGQKWEKINGWGDYYNDVENKLHADIMDINSYFDENGKEVILICCHGGLYVSRDKLRTVKNLSMLHHNIGQYYSTITSFHEPDIIYVGTQDQGYQRSEIDTTTGILGFTQVISGDYGHMVSSDSARTFWMTYPGFLAYLPNPRSGGLTAWWDYTSKGQLWMAPLMADPDNPAAVYMCGGSPDGSGGKLYHIKSVGGKAEATVGTFDFGAQLTEAAYSPINTNVRYVMTSKGEFYATFDGGKVWAKRGAGLPGGHYFYGNNILPSSVKAGRVYMSGSGYSNPGALVSEDNGSTWLPLGLETMPRTLFFHLAATPDEKFIFAATESGPYVYAAYDQSWHPMHGLQPGGAPDQSYWWVEYVQPINTVRFSTYGRGVWDFEIQNSTPSVAAKIIAENMQTLCERRPALFSAQILQGGKKPQYIWKVNGKEYARTAKKTMEIPGLRNGDIVICEVVSSSNGAKAESNRITMNMRPSVEIGLSALVQGQAPASASQPMTFTAMPLGSAKNLLYKWVRGYDTTETSSPEFRSDNIKPGDLVVCEMRSTTDCTFPETAIQKIGIAHFSATVFSVNAVGRFTNLTPYGEQWLWDFGDGTTSTVKNPAKIYEKPGQYDVVLTVFPGNTTYRQTVTAGGATALPYFNNFEENDGGFRSVSMVTDNDGNMWEWGKNETGKKFFNGKNGVVEGNKSWITNIGRHQGVGALYALETPDFSLVGLQGDCRLKFSFRQMTGSGGGMRVDYSQDKGNSWSRLGKANDGKGIYWYNASDLWALDGDGFNNFSLNIQKSSYLLNEFIGSSSIRFRFVNGTPLEEDDGIILDEFGIEGSATTVLTPVETAISGSVEWIPANGSADFFSENGKIIATIANLSDINFGKVSVEVATEGADADKTTISPSEFEFFPQKTIRVQADSLQPNSKFSITLYYTEKEANGWKTASGKNIQNSIVVKADNIFSQANVAKKGQNAKVRSAFGADWAFSSEFSESLSGVFAFGAPTSVGIAEIDELTSVIYPNPASDIVFTTIVDAESVEFQSLDGKTTLMQTISGNSFSIQSLSAGTYIVRIIKNGEIVAIDRIVKQ